MKIAIIGAGFTGLSAAYYLSKSGHDVMLFEKENSVGGLANDFKPDGWEWGLEKHYHHIFTSDKDFLGLASEIGFLKEIFFKRPITSVFNTKKGIFPFDSPISIITSPVLSFTEKARLGATTFLLRIIPNGIFLEKWTAYEFLIKTMGKGAFSKIFEPLINGKFGPYAKKVNMAWFWARIKKRSPSLGYMRGGFQAFADKILEKTDCLGAKYYLGCTVRWVTEEGAKWKVGFVEEGAEKTEIFDKILFTTPSEIFCRYFPNLDFAFKEKILSVPHLSALNLVITTTRNILKKTYWLNINEKGFPFLAVVEHTNFVDKSHYGDSEIIYIGNYLPNDHSFFKLTKEELIVLYEPYIKKINNDFTSKWIIDSYLFNAPYAQPVMEVNYSKNRSFLSTPFKNVYLANMDTVYPWDRGTNYAIELGRRAAELMVNEK